LETCAFENVTLAIRAIAMINNFFIFNSLKFLIQ
jgi:hypothetical protein